MKSPPEKGQFTTEIGDDVLAEALKAVDKRTGKTEEEEAAAQAAASAAPAAPVASSAELEQLKAELEFSQARGRDLMAKLKDEHEKMLRAAADLENYKKRAQKEKEEVQRFGIEKLLKDFLPVFDNFDRALDAAKTPNDFDSLRKGVEMIRKLFEDTLGRHGVKAFSAKGQPFDPNRHEAMTAAETSEMPPNHVFSEVLRGFTLNDRLVRPALVIVSRTPSAPATVDAPPPAEAEGTKQ
ncbi:MAG: nucleotide exchange factor GrpE [Myxococcota bacterium]